MSPAWQNAVSQVKLWEREGLAIKVKGSITNTFLYIFLDLQIID